MNSFLLGVGLGWVFFQTAHGTRDTFNWKDEEVQREHHKLKYPNMMDKYQF